MKKTDSFEKIYKNNNQFIAYQKINDKSNNYPGIIFFGGFQSNMWGNKASKLYDYCTDKNIPFIRFDYSGHGESFGVFTEGTIGQWLEDSLFIIDNLIDKPYIFIGSSMGGWLMLLAAIKRPHKVKGLIGIASAPDFTEKLIWEKISLDQKQKLNNQGMIKITIGNDPNEFPITSKLIQEARDHLLLDKEIKIDCPTILLHGMLDQVVPYNVSLKIAEQITSKKVITKLIKETDHSFSSENDINVLINSVNELIT